MTDAGGTLVLVALLALAGLAVLLTGPAPRLMARRGRFRRLPGPALLVWQAVSLAGVVSALGVAPASTAARATSGLPRWVAAVAWAFSALMLARLLWSGHRVGTRLRGERRRHRELVDVLGTNAVDGTGTAALYAGAGGGVLRVLAHPTPTAYCLPGLRRRVVLTEGALAALPPDQLAAVMAHERAHLRERHDLVLEFFTVLHTAVPARLRAEAAIQEVRLLIEVLADRSARRIAGPVALARALVTLAQGSHPDTALGAGRSTAERMALLAEPDGPRWLAVAMVGFALIVLAAPVALLVLALR